MNREKQAYKFLNHILHHQEMTEEQYWMEVWILLRQKFWKEEDRYYRERKLKGGTNDLH